MCAPTPPLHWQRSTRGRLIFPLPSLAVRNPILCTGRPVFWGKEVRFTDEFTAVGGVSHPQMTPRAEGTATYWTIRPTLITIGAVANRPVVRLRSGQVDLSR